jgi:hypothetical protein
MTTNQTIDGVPRELISDCIAYLQGSHRAEVNICIRLMRDLLERDNDTSLVPGAHEFKGTPLPTKADYQRLDEALNKIGMITPDAQPQGEPVAWMQPGQDAMCISHKVKLHSLKIGGAPASAVAGYSIPLYAEQPAPVAVVMPVDPERERLMEIVQQYPNVDPLKYDAAVRTLRK